MSSKISALSAASPLAGTESFPLVQAGTTKKGLISDIVTYLLGLANTWSLAQTFTVAPVFTQKRQSAAALGSWHVIAASAVQVTHTGDTAEFALATITLPAGCMGANGAVRVTAHFDATDSANNKTHRIRFGGISGGVARAITLNTSAHAREQAVIQNRNAANSQILGDSGGQHGGWGATTAFATAAIDTTAAVDIVLTSQLTNSGETSSIESYIVEVFYQA